MHCTPDTTVHVKAQAGDTALKSLPPFTQICITGTDDLFAAFGNHAMDEHAVHARGRGGREIKVICANFATFLMKPTRTKCWAIHSLQVKLTLTRVIYKINLVVVID